MFQSLQLRLLGVAAVIALIQGCSSAQSATEKPQPQPVAVTLAPAEQQMIAQTSEYVAQLQSRRSVQLRPQVEGRIRRIYARSGQQVAAGAVLMEIDPRAQQEVFFAADAAVRAALAERDNARAQLAVLQAERLEAQTAVTYARRERDRFARLYGEGALSRQELDRAEAHLAAAQARLGAATSRLNAQHALIARAGRAIEQQQAQASAQRVQLGYFRVEAPLAGRVGDVPVRVGDYVSPVTELTTITDNRQLEVHVAIPVEQAATLSPGLPLALHDALDQPLATARIQFVSARVDETTQSVLVKATVDNPEGRLRADQFVRARLTLRSSPGVLVPATAVSRIAGQDFVFVAQPAKEALVARQRAVQLAGDLVNDQYAVASGLKPGEQVVVSGVQKLIDGAPIQASARL